MKRREAVAAMAIAPLERAEIAAVAYVPVRER